MSADTLGHSFFIIIIIIIIITIIQLHKVEYK